jgi:hypothetical protein
VVYCHQDRGGDCHAFEPILTQTSFKTLRLFKRGKTIQGRPQNLTHAPELQQYTGMLPETNA